MDLTGLLSGGDLRSIGQSNHVVGLIKNQADFDNLFQFLFHENRLIAMKAADAIEKITVSTGGYLTKHKHKLIRLCKQDLPKEIKWHLALLVSRITLYGTELEEIWRVVSSWALDKTESRIVRVNSLQALFTITENHKQFRKELNAITVSLRNENIPSLNARIKKLHNEHQ